MESPESVSEELAVSPLVAQMRAAGLEVTQQFYGFSGFGTYRDGGVTFECGTEHDGSTSLSAVFGNTPPGRWFVRDTPDQMAAFLMAAQERLRNGDSTTWRDAMTHLDPGIEPGN